MYKFLILVIAFGLPAFSFADSIKVCGYYGKSVGSLHPFSNSSIGNPKLAVRTTDVEDFLEKIANGTKICVRGYYVIYDRGPHNFVRSITDEEVIVGSAKLCKKKDHIECR